MQASDSQDVLGNWQVHSQVMDSPAAKLHDQVEYQDAAFMTIALHGACNHAVRRPMIRLPSSLDQRDELLPQKDRNQAFFEYGIALSKPALPSFNESRMDHLVHEAVRVKAASEDGKLAFRVVALAGHQ